MIYGLMCIRKGSKGIPHKNTRPFLGKPLFMWNLEALSSCVKTTLIHDGVSQGNIPENCGWFNRSDKSATDGVSVFVALQEWVNNKIHGDDGLFLRDIVLLTQATSPYLSMKDVAEALRLLDTGYDSVLTCGRDKRFYWKPDGTMLDGMERTNQVHRQQWAGHLVENGCLYGCRVETLLKNRLLDGRIGIIEQPFSFELDEIEDWAYGERTMMRHRGVDCFDVDGTLCHTPAGSYEDATPIQENIQKVNALYDAGRIIVIETARGAGSGIDFRDLTKDQLAAWGVKYHILRMGKPPASRYFDDRAEDIGTI